MTVEPALEAHGVAAERGGRRVIHDIDLVLARGEVVALLGPNGAGKTTLLSVLAGLEPPAAGRVERRGRVAAALQAPDLARRSVRANVEAALGWWGVPREQRRPRALAALERLHAGQLAERSARTLSGGEQRRVHLARAVAVDADVLLLDEPFAGLDLATRAELLHDAAGALRDPDRATLLVVHDRAEAWALADRLLVLLDGRIAADGPPRALLESPPSPRVAAFLGFDGRIERDGRLLLTRPVHTAVDPDGAFAGTITHRVPLEDGVRVRVELLEGHLWTEVAPPGPQLGERITLRVLGGTSYPLPAPDGVDARA